MVTDWKGIALRVALVGQNVPLGYEKPMPEWLYILRTGLGLMCAMAAVPGVVQAAPVVLCEEAAQFAAEQTGVPLSILQAVTLAETGQTKFDRNKFAPWPWAVQSGAKGNWFPDSRSAIAFTRQLTAQGISNIDIGCFQLNLRWHAEAFENLEDMFSPKNNALYAAAFLQRLYQQTGDWRAAVGRYHSRDDERAESYLQRLETIFETYLADSPPGPAQMRSAALPQAVSAPQKFGLVFARGPLLQSPIHPRPIIGGSP